MRDTRITELPENLSVVGSLDLRETRITTLPENLIVGQGVIRTNRFLTGLYKLLGNLMGTYPLCKD